MNIRLRRQLVVALIFLSMSIEGFSMIAGAYDLVKIFGGLCGGLGISLLILSVD